MNSMNGFPIIIGHRGASKYAPENTIPAFQLALEQGADGFELDTMLSADGVPVVIHDRSVARTTNGLGKVDELSIKELHSLDAGSWFSEKFVNTRIPPLEEVLGTFSGSGLINIELKNLHSPNDKLTERVIELVEKVDGFSNILFSSFNSKNLRKIAELHPEAKIGLLVMPGFLSGIKQSIISRSIRYEYIHPHFSVCSAKYIRKQHAFGRSINTWTVNNKNIINSLSEKGIDGIITNDPELAVKIRQQYL